MSQSWWAWWATPSATPPSPCWSPPSPPPPPSLAQSSPTSLPSSASGTSNTRNTGGHCDRSYSDWGVKKCTVIVYMFFENGWSPRGMSPGSGGKGYGLDISMFTVFHTYQTMCVCGGGGGVGEVSLCFTVQHTKSKVPDWGIKSTLP